MLPAYVAMHLTGQGKASGLVGPFGTALRAGASTTVGFAAIYLTLGVVLSEALRAVTRIIPVLSVAVAIAIITVAVASFLRFPISTGRLLSLGGQPPTSGFLYGVAYALSSLGCTLPIFLMLVTYASTFASLVGIVMAMIAYSFGFLIMMLSFSLVLVISADYLTKIGSLVRRASDFGSLLAMVVGIYLLMYQVRYSALFR